MKRNRGWVVEGFWDDRWHMLGKYWRFGCGTMEPVPDRMNGYRTAVFETRSKARAAQRAYKEFKTATPTRVTHVSVTIERLEKETPARGGGSRG